MLQAIHGQAKTWIILPLFGLLILSFVVWGIADVFQNNSGTAPVITVGKIEYSGQQLQAEVQRGLDVMRQMTGGAITNEQAMQFGFVERTVNSMVQRALLQQEAGRLGIVVSDEVIMQAIRDLPEFKNADGSFDAEAFKRALMRIGANEQLFIQDQRVTLARAQVQQVVTSGAMAPDILNRAIIAASEEQRDFDIFRVKAAAMPLPADPGDETLQAFLADNAARFSTTEYRALSFIRLSVSDLAEKITIEDQAVAAYYQQNPQEFEMPERRNFLQVVLPEQETAVNIIGAYALTKDLATAAKSVGAEVTPITASKNELPEELRETAFTLTNGGISKPVQSALGWHVLVQTAQTPAHKKTLAEAGENIKNNLLQQAAQDRLYQLSAELDDLIASGASLEEMASQLSLPIKKVEATDKAGNNPAGTALGPVLGQPEMVAAAFTLEAGTQSDVISTPAGDYVVVRVDSINASRLQDLASVRAAALKEWQAEQQQNAATELALKVLAEAKNGTDRAAIAQQFGIEASTQNKLARTETDWPSHIPVAFTTNLFALKMQDVAQFPTDEGVIVARLTGIHHPISVADAKGSEDFAQKSNQVIEGELFEAYTQALRQRFAVKIDQPAIDRLFKSAEAE